MQYHFPDGFIWGAATAALQIEGAVDEGGRGPSHWDVYRREHPERFWQDASPDIACDHYHRYREDVTLIKQLGHNGYRLSIAWPRIYPAGTGQLNQEGVDFYGRLFDALVEQGIQPNVTLYHWDLPDPLAQRGGWENRATVDAFVRYSETCFRSFGDRVKMWATLNEPDIVVMNGYMTALYPPCKHDYRAAIVASHNLNLAHSRAVQLYHSLGQGGQIGTVIDLSTVYPATDSPEDAAAAQIADGMLNRWFTDPAVLGRYPEDMLKLYAGLDWLPQLPDEEMASLSAGTVDWIGINYYFPYYASAAAAETSFSINTTGNRHQSVMFSIEGLFKFVRNPTGRYTDWGWEINPEALYHLLERADQYRKGLPLYITENGIGLQDQLVNDTVDDQARIDFVREHLRVIHQAITNGINVRGYYMWALMDNFSWLSGYKKRYGFLYVDRATLRRYRKKSSYWYQEVAEKNGF